METLLTYHIDTGLENAFASVASQFQDERLLYTAGLFFAHTAPVVLVNGLHWLLQSAVGKLALEPYRWQTGKEPPTALVRKCVVYVATFHLVVPLLPWLMFSRAVAYHPGMFSDPVPGLLPLLCQLAVAYFFTDFLFYWGHRFLHTPLAYRWIHKQHHQFYVSIGLAAEYAHPIELFVGNIVPVTFAPIVFKYHFSVLCLWICIAMTGTIMQHSGYGFPLTLSDDFHDFHHSHVVCNFGSMPLWDVICGTNKQYKAFKAKQAQEQRRQQR